VQRHGINGGRQLTSLSMLLSAGGFMGLKSFRKFFAAEYEEFVVVR
jgi:hypothetical protein